MKFRLLFFLSFQRHLIRVLLMANTVQHFLHLSILKKLTLNMLNPLSLISFEVISKDRFQENDCFYQFGYSRSVITRSTASVRLNLKRC